MLCWFLLYDSVNQPYMYVYPLRLEPPSPRPPTPALQVIAVLWVELPTSDYLHVVVCVCLFWSPTTSHPLFPLLCPQVCSLHLHLYSFPANIFISTIFLDSIYVLIYNICFLCDYHFNKSFLLIHFLLTCRHLKTIEVFFFSFSGEFLALKYLFLLIDFLDSYKKWNTL